MTAFWGPDEVAAALLTGIFYLVFLIWSKRRRKNKATEFFREDNTPIELQSARLYGSEQHISCATPIALKGTYDQLYLTPDDNFILSDTKTRNRPYVYQSDIIQLSAYKLILEQGSAFSGKRIMPHGYLRIVCKGKTHYKKIDLMTEEDVIELYERRQALYRGEIEPQKADTPVKCTRCHQLASCGGVKRYKRHSRRVQKKHNSPNGLKNSDFKGWD